MRISDWSSDVFSSDLLTGAFGHLAGNGPLTIGGIEVVATDADGDHTTAHVAVEVVDDVPTADLSANGATTIAEDASGQLTGTWAAPLGADGAGWVTFPVGGGAQTLESDTGRVGEE